MKRSAPLPSRQGGGLSGEALKKAVAAKLRAAKLQKSGDSSVNGSGIATTSTSSSSAGFNNSSDGGSSSRSSSSSSNGNSSSSTSKNSDNGSGTRSDTRGSSLLKWDSAKWSSWVSSTDTSDFPGTEFVIFKVPLAQVYESTLPDDAKRLLGSAQFFTVDELANGQQLSLVVDATPDASRVLYSREELYDEWDIERTALEVEESQVAESSDPATLRFLPPSQQQVDKFLNECRRIWNHDVYSKIGVCSSLGMNRAGVLIISYLVEEKRVPLQEALRRFAQVRPPGVYAKPCLLALQKRLGANQHVDMPAAPQWDTFAVACGCATSTPSMLPPQQIRSAVESQEEHKAAPAKPKPFAMPAPVPVNKSADGTSKVVEPPKPWKRAFSNREKRYYFFNPLTKKSVWRVEDCK